MSREKIHDQEIFFDNGTRRYVVGVVKSIQGTWWHMYTADGKEIIVNPNRVLFIRIPKKHVKA